MTKMVGKGEDLVAAGKNGVALERRARVAVAPTVGGFLGGVAKVLQGVGDGVAPGWLGELVRAQTKRSVVGWIRPSGEFRVKLRCVEGNLKAEAYPFERPALLSGGRREHMVMVYLSPLTQG